MRRALTRNWFYPMAGALLLVLLVALRISSDRITSADYAGFEKTLVFDAVVSLPLLYWLCFRRSHRAGALVTGMLAIACCGLWLAGWIVPERSQILLPKLSWLRPVVLAGLALVEIRLAVAAFRIIFKPSTKTSDLQDAGIPPLVARLMLAEARFWRWVFSLIRK